MVMKRQADRFSQPPKLENARNVDAGAQAPVAGAPLTVKSGVWAPEQDVTTSYFFAVAAAPISAGSPVTFTAVGIVAATTGTVHGIAALSATAGASIPVLRQGRLTLPGTLPENSLLYIDESGKITTAGSAKAYVIGFTKAANDARIFIGGAGGSGGGGSGGGGAADGVTITENPDGTLSVVNTAVPRANTTVRTQPNGKISSDLLDTANIFSGMQVRYLVPENTTWDREPDKCVETSGLPKVPTSGQTYRLPSPFGTKPGVCVVWLLRQNGWYVHTPTIASPGDDRGTIAACSGDGWVHVTVAKQAPSTTATGLAAPASGVEAVTDICIAVYCQVTEVVATHIVGNRQYYLTAPGSSWDKGGAADRIELPDMPLKFAGGTARNYKWASPFGSKLVPTEAWIKFVGVWRRCEDTLYHNPNHYGVRSACPGDGYIYANISQYPCNSDTAINSGNIPIGTTGTAGNTYKDYEICIIASVDESVELPTISAKELFEDTVKYTGWVDISAVAKVNTTVDWVAPSNGYIRAAVAGASGADVRVSAEDNTGYLIRLYSTGVTTVATAWVEKDKTYPLYRNNAGSALLFKAAAYDETKYALYSRTGGSGPVSPEDGIRVGEVRNYSRYDAEIADNKSFLNISEASEVDTNSYPEFATLVGVTGPYPIPAAEHAGAQSVPYIYLGKFTGTTPPAPLLSDVSISDSAQSRITFMVDGDLEISVPLITVGPEGTALTSPALLFSVEGEMDPVDARLTTAESTDAEPSAPGVMLRYTRKG